MSLLRDAYQLTSESWVTITRRPGLFHKYYKVWSEPKGLEAYPEEFVFLCARKAAAHIII